MKNTTRTIIIALVAITLFSFKVAYELRKNTAEVETTNGVMIFYRSTPQMPYDVLGTYKIKFIDEATPAKLSEKLLDKTKEKYPNLDGVIIAADMESCTAIKMK